MNHKRPLPIRVKPVTIVNRIKQHLPHDRPSAIDVVYDELDELLLASRFDDVSAALDAIVGSDLPVSVLMSARVVCAPWSERIGESFDKLIRKARGRPKPTSVPWRKRYPGHGMQEPSR